MVLASALRREFTDEMASLLNRNVRMGDPREPHDLLRFLNLRLFMLSESLTMTQVCQVLIEIHRLADVQKFRRVSQWGLGVGVAVLFGPQTRESFSVVAEEMFPGSGDRRKLEIRMSELSKFVDPSPLSEDPFRFVSEYKQRLSSLRTKEEEIRRFRRLPFRGSPWR